MDSTEIDRITELIIGCAYRVSNTLGTGFLEKVYENALAHELHKAHLRVEQQQPIRVVYDGVVVGDFYADLVVESAVLVELKAAKALDDLYVAQCLNYLTATRMHICLLINFGKTKVEVKRLAR